MTLVVGLVRQAQPAAWHFQPPLGRATPVGSTWLATRIRRRVLAEAVHAGDTARRAVEVATVGHAAIWLIRQLSRQLRRGVHPHCAGRGPDG